MGTISRYQLASLLVIATGAGCGSSASTPDGVSAACAALITYEGRTYRGSAVRVVPVAGERLGEATKPACADTPGVAAPAERVEVHAIDGVQPDVAVVLRGEESTVFIREDVELEPPPPELERLLREPRCSSEDEPIVLSGPWQGILGADGHTELDLAPPYDVMLLAENASPERYSRAYLSVRVPVELGRPLDRKDVETSLWEGGTISITARCRGTSLVATTVDASPPAG